MTTESGLNYLVKLQDVASGANVVTFFVHGGVPLDAAVPTGNFTLKYAAGRFWCGDKDLFGPDTTVSLAEDPFLFDKGDQWTVRLILGPDGNLRVHPIPLSQF